MAFLQSFRKPFLPFWLGGDKLAEFHCFFRVSDKVDRTDCQPLLIHCATWPNGRFAITSGPNGNKILFNPELAGELLTEAIRRGKNGPVFSLFSTNTWRKVSPSVDYHLRANAETVKAIPFLVLDPSSDWKDSRPKKTLLAASKLVSLFQNPVAFRRFCLSHLRSVKKWTRHYNATGTRGNSSRQNGRSGHTRESTFTCVNNLAQATFWGRPWSFDQPFNALSVAVFSPCC